MTDKNKIDFPLVDSSYDNQEIIRCIETILSGQLTMGPRVREFEQAFCNYIGSPRGLMVNSGSSANLLAFATITNPARPQHLVPGDKVAIPAVCWSTSLWPILQHGLVPVLIDVDPGTLNLSIPSLKAAMSRHAFKAIMMVHILGNSTELSELLTIVKDNDLILIEDTCESLGSQYGGQNLGTLGDFGTFSFYFSHHMTTIEGGFILAKSEADWDLLKCLRTHGWSREQSNRDEIERSNPDIDPRFLFINVGYNLRPMELQAAFGLEQIKRLPAMNQDRRRNVQRIHAAFRAHPRWENQLAFPRATEGLDPCWFGLPFLLQDKLPLDYKGVVSELMHRGVDTRPIVSGNMALQPAVKLFPVDLGMAPFGGAQAVHDRGLFIGCHAKPLEQDRIERLVDNVLSAIRGSS